MRTLVVIALLAMGSMASAANYQGYGDTGWSFLNKRDCCDAAIAWAQEDSMVRCEQSGGLPSTRFGTRRGTCKWQWRQDGYGQRVYRCWSETTVNCR